MQTGRYVLSTISRLVTSRLLYRIAVAISVIFVSRYLIVEPAIADTFEVAHAAASILMIASEIGMSMVLMKSGATQSKEALAKRYGTALAIETVAWNLLLLIAVGGYAMLHGLTSLFWLLLLLGINQAVIQYRVVIRAIYRSLYLRERITYIEVIDGLVKLIGIWWITQTITDRETGAYAIALFYAITTIIFIAIYAFHSFHIVRPQWSRVLVQPMMKEGIWYNLQAIIMTVYFEIDKLVMRFFQQTGLVDIADGDIARYGAAARIVVFFLLFHRIGLQVITPYLYASFPNQLERYRRIVRFSTRYMSAAGVGIGAGIIALAPEIVATVYGPRFSGIELALQLFGLFFIVRFMGITSAQVFATTGNQPKRTKQEGLAVILNIILDVLLIPFFGYLGGAIATLITEAVTQCVFFAMTRRLIQDNIPRSLIQLIPALCAGLVMGITVYISKGYLPLWLSVLTGMLLYAALLFFFRFFSKEDQKLLRSTP